MPDRRAELRAVARQFEESIPAAQRKLLGQFFTGIRLGKLLAHLAIEPTTRTVLDPMAGNGDLLDATLEVASERSVTLKRIDGIEIDRASARLCEDRIAALAGTRRNIQRAILCGDAFSSEANSALPEEGYDLVITNPPYVRYQSMSAQGRSERDIRANLIQIVKARTTVPMRESWKTLAASYSGLADLSVPSWLLAAIMVRPGGRLAIVVPATWRSRDYADVIKYMLSRLFRIEYIVEDTQPGWFSDALVRTQLVVARRLDERRNLSSGLYELNEHYALSIHIAPEAADDVSLVGAAFVGPHPEAALAQWALEGAWSPRRGLSTQRWNLGEEWASVEAKSGKRPWFRKLAARHSDTPLFSVEDTRTKVSLPSDMRDVTDGIEGRLLTNLASLGIQVGQGLRTGCNGFFYLDEIGAAEKGSVEVRTSALFGQRRFVMPQSTLRPAIRGQAALRALAHGSIPTSRVLDLNGWVLPEDHSAALVAKSSYARARMPIPQPMPPDLADYVRAAAKTPAKDSAGALLIPDLSAVRTNIRSTSTNGKIPRFWYMLPHFAPRHLPAAFVARINNGAPWTEANLEPPLLIDANFSTVWSSDGSWSRYALKALLNSTWCRTCMEAVGTRLGGGALKLEASHIRHLPVPILDRPARLRLDVLGRDLSRDNDAALDEINQIVLGAIVRPRHTQGTVSDLAQRLVLRMTRLEQARQRVAP